MSTLTPKEEDIKLLIVAGCHFAGKKITKQKKKYMCAVRSDDTAIFNVNKIYEKTQVAARIIGSIDPDSVISISGKSQNKEPSINYAVSLKLKQLIVDGVQVR